MMLNTVFHILNLMEWGPRNTKVILSAFTRTKLDGFDLRAKKPDWKTFFII